MLRVGVHSSSVYETAAHLQGHSDGTCRLGNILLSTTLAVSIGLGAVIPPTAQAEDSYQKRREDMERRKEMLAKT